MTSKSTWIIAGVLAVGSAAAVAFAQPTTQPKHAVPAPKHGGTVVELCDGQTSVEIDGAMTPAKAQHAADDLMATWRAKHPKAAWEVADAGKPPQAPPSPRPGITPSSQADVYGGYDSRDEQVWANETQKFVDQGNAIFHDAKALGGTVAMSCDMCHPNGANTHPETYPKFQVQLGRVALLRDMINWCIENPVKGKPMADDDPRLRALEAYILSQRKGVALDYGRH